MALALLGIAVIGCLDFLTGHEIRMFPLYFAPVGYATVSRGRGVGVALSALSAVVWFGSNLLAGLRVSNQLLAINAVLHFLACGWIALLIARLRATTRSDTLTGLPNRRALDDRIAIELARLHRGSGSLVVACLDLDGFKAVNDREGHAAGDRLLRRVSDALREHLRRGHREHRRDRRRAARPAGPGPPARGRRRRALPRQTGGTQPRRRRLSVRTSPRPAARIRSCG